ncbi:protein sickie-like [Culicoides brevitarsis]|uniref:protein sickie-like n=1 Tax=Culicoides brevitarsis TaxID=469753 RepID=UPI00307C7AA3
MNIHELITIYTEWANYYLERKSKRKIVDLSEDIRDGLLLAELIEVVTSYKVPDLTKKPKTPKQMHDNVNSCLSLLKQQEVGGLEDINASDICAGRLKAILSLFFALSRHKQASKQRSGSRKQDPNMGPSPYQSPYHQPQVVVQQQQSMQQSQQQPQER